MVFLAFYLLNRYSIFIGFGYGHPNVLHQYMLDPRWLDAAYMTYAFPEYFRQQQHNPQFSRGNVIHNFMLCHLCENLEAILQIGSCVNEMNMEKIN